LKKAILVAMLFTALFILGTKTDVLAAKREVPPFPYDPILVSEPFPVV